MGHSRKEKLNWGFIIWGVVEIHVPQLHFLVVGMASRSAVIPTVLTHLVVCCERQSGDLPTCEHVLQHQPWKYLDHGGETGLKYSESETSVCRILPNLPALKETRWTEFCIEFN